MNEIDHPAHYNAHPSGVEAIDLCELIGFNLGNAVKYLMRADHKGAAERDREKAAWYLRREANKVLGESCWRSLGGTSCAYARKVRDAEPDGTHLALLLDVLVAPRVEGSALLQVADQIDPR